MKDEDNFGPGRPGIDRSRSVIARSAVSDDPEETEAGTISPEVVKEIATWKRDARSEDNDRYFWHIDEIDQIARGEKYFIIGRKGSGKTAISEYLHRQPSYESFSERLSFKTFPFNDLYSNSNQKYTAPNQFITLWKYVIYNTICQLMLNNESVDGEIRRQLRSLYQDTTTLKRRISHWTGTEFGLSLFGSSIKFKSTPPPPSGNWIERVDLLEDLILEHGGGATYLVLFDELDEDYQKIVEAEDYTKYIALITSLFKAVQDVRSTFSIKDGYRIFPIIFLRDDIYDQVQDADKNKWADFRVDLTWDEAKLKKAIAFRISRAIDATCEQTLPFHVAWNAVFGRNQVGGGRKRISTFDFIARSTLRRPRDFVVYLQQCAEYATEERFRIRSYTVKLADKKFSNYLRGEFTDELAPVLPDIRAVFDTISQLRKWSFTIAEFTSAYNAQVGRGFINERNVNKVLQVLYSFSVIGNHTKTKKLVFRYQNPEARLNFSEQVVVHRGLLKALQIW